MRQWILLGWILLGWFVLGGLVDPRVCWQAWRLRPAVEPLGVLRVGAVEGGLSSCADVGCGSVVD
jgi:hypothetical protein